MVADSERSLMSSLFHCVYFCSSEYGVHQQSQMRTKYQRKQTRKRCCNIFVLKRKQAHFMLSSYALSTPSKVRENFLFHVCVLLHTLKSKSSNIYKSGGEFTRPAIHCDVCRCSIDLPAFLLLLLHTVHIYLLCVCMSAILTSLQLWPLQ